MNIERLYLVTDTLKKEIISSQIESHLTTIINALSNHISQPNKAYLDQVSQGLDSLKNALEKSYLNELPKTWTKVISEIGANDFVGMALYENVRSSVISNERLPNEGLSDIQALDQRLKDFVNAADQLQSSMQKLGISYESLEEGEVELSVVLPREIFSNELKGFTEEAKLIDNLIRTASEIATGSPENAKIKQLETSDPTIILTAGAGSVLLVLQCVHSVQDIFKNVQEIRLAKAQAEKAELEVSIIKKIDEQATKKIEAHIKAFAKEQTKSTRDEGRKNELEILLVKRMRQLAARMDRGMKIEGAVGVSEDSEDDESNQTKESQTLQSIQQLSEEIRYFPTQVEPILSLPLNEDDLAE
ncbi:MAG: hypothetical protein ACK551_01650 [Vampirovibrionales bacterium]